MSNNELTDADAEATTAIRGYSKPRTYGDKYLRDLHKDIVVIQEKIDGSQFSFRICPDTGELLFKTRNKMITLETCEAQFRPTVEHLLAHKDSILPGYTYRGEAMSSARHNKLKYDRAPLGNFVLFDVEHDDGTYLGLDLLCDAARHIEVELVQEHGHLNPGQTLTDEHFQAIMAKGSQLGGVPEGVVLKNYWQKDPNDPSKVLMAKVVSAEFKETKKSPIPKSSMDLSSIIDTYRVEARWEKAVQHLKDSGELTGTPADIGKIMAEVSRDLEKEEAESIKDLLYSKFRKQILKGATEGLAQWYKDRLASEAVVSYDFVIPRPDLVSPDAPSDSL